MNEILSRDNFHCVFSFLNIETILCRVPKVCRHWHEICLDVSFYRHLLHDKDFVKKNILYPTSFKKSCEKFNRIHWHYQLAFVRYNRIDRFFSHFLSCSKVHGSEILRHFSNHPEYSFMNSKMIEYGNNICNGLEDQTVLYDEKVESRMKYILYDLFYPSEGYYELFGNDEMVDSIFAFSFAENFMTSTYINRTAISFHLVHRSCEPNTRKILLIVLKKEHSQKRIDLKNLANLVKSAFGIK